MERRLVLALQVQADDVLAVEPGVQDEDDAEHGFWLFLARGQAVTLRGRFAALAFDRADSGCVCSSQWRT